MTTKMTSAEQKTFENLVQAYNNARLDIENFLEELKGEWESDLEDAAERIQVLEGWMDEVSNDFDPDTSEVS